MAWYMQGNRSMKLAYKIIVASKVSDYNMMPEGHIYFDETNEDFTSFFQDILMCQNKDLLTNDDDDVTLVEKIDNIK